MASQHRHEPGDFWTRPHCEPVVLDIGADVGALVLYTPPERHGQEIEISPIGDDAARVHTAVLERIVDGRTIYAAVYAELPAGAYRLHDGDPSLPTGVTITAGCVAELDWRRAADQAGDAQRPERAR
jgi:hypothetical protein